MKGVKADVDFGPTLMLNRNRCILCTRCVRFMREVEGDAQIGIIDRGAGSEIATFREEGVHSLLSGNLMDVCPVGAITTRDYRFKARPWDNPNVVDTTCTLCSKGCSTSAWLKAKPEWAKGSQLIRMTPRFNPEVNGYWMCDIGRFQYHWIEGESRLRKPMLRQGNDLQPVAWHDAEPRLRDRIQQAGSADPESVRFLVSAHAATEELFVLKDVVEGMVGPEGLKSVAVTWTRSDKPQPAGNKFPIPAVDAPNVAGARDLGFDVGDGQTPNLSRLKNAVAAGKVRVLYVVSPGPDGSLGDTSWIVEARRAGTLPTLVVQGVVMNELVAAADIVLPGAAFVEKDALFTNDQGRVQAVSRAIAPPGEAREDWQILANVGRALGLPLGYQSSADVRRAIAAALPNGPYGVRRERAVLAAGVGAALAAGVESVGTLEVGLHVPGPAAGEGPQRPDGRPAEPDSAQPDRLIMKRRGLAAVVLLLLSAFPAGAQLRKRQGRSRHRGRIRRARRRPGPRPSRGQRSGRVSPPVERTARSVAHRDHAHLPDDPGVRAEEVVYPKATDFILEGQTRTARGVRAPLPGGCPAVGGGRDGGRTDRGAGAFPLSGLQRQAVLRAGHGRRPLDAHRRRARRRRSRAANRISSSRSRSVPARHRRRKTSPLPL